jgi:ribosomal protein S18 acetylase RimI-like enzyme
MSGPDGVSPARFGWVRVGAAGLLFRPITTMDLPFLYQVYAWTRTEELAAVPWSDEQKVAFLTMQFRAQHADYERNYSSADRLVILHGGVPIGRLYVERGEREHSVIDIAFLPEHRGQGFGGALMRDLMDEAGRAGKPLSIYVEKFNPAMRLYRRLGFETIEDKGVYNLMRWNTRTQVNTAS